MILDCERLPRPIYLFGKGAKFHSPYQGLRTAGPYGKGVCPLNPRILFVYPNEMKDFARTLYFSLRNGIGPFRGTEALFGFKLAPERIQRLDQFSVKGLPDAEAATKYHEAIVGYLEEHHEPADLAFIIHKRTERSHQANPYLASKFPLLEANIPTQVVTEELVSSETSFQWSVGNIALAMFAKMGGQPWAVETGLAEDSLVVGVNRAIIHGDAPDQSHRVYGFASTFSHNGVYLGTTMFPPANNWSEYIAGLRQAVTSSIETWRDAVGTPVSLVLHVRKEVRKEETDVLEECLANADGNLIRAYAVLRLAEADDVLILDPNNADALIPPPGLMVNLAGHRAILQIAGSDPADASLGKGISSHPLLVTLLKSSPSSPDFQSLCRHILALGAMNWRGFNAEASPVSMQYPHLVAEMLGRFEQGGYEVGRLRDVPVLIRPWFI